MQQTILSPVPRWRWWLRALRPTTLPLSALPTLVGIAWAWRAGAWEPINATLTVLCAVLLQIIANFVNELGDYSRGADTPSRVGPPRAVSLGMISPAAMRRASVLLSLVVLVLGLVLVQRVGWWLLALGVVVLVLAWLYTSGPRPLAYIGLGEVTAFVFFGLVPCGGAYAIQHGAVSYEPMMSGIALGSFAAAVLGINNLRDRALDSACGKRTLAVRLGHVRATRLVQWLLALPYFVLVGLSIGYPLTSAALVSLPIAWSVARELSLDPSPAYNRLLRRTVLASSIYGIVLSSSIVVDTQP